MGVVRFDLISFDSIPIHFNSTFGSSNVLTILFVNDSWLMQVHAGKSLIDSSNFDVSSVISDGLRLIEFFRFFVCL